MLNQNNFVEMAAAENKISEIKAAIEKAEHDYPQAAKMATEAGFPNVRNAKVAKLKKTLETLENKIKTLGNKTAS